MRRRKVFAVSSGMYSDRRTHFVCQTQEEAEACIAKMGRTGDDEEDYDIEELPVVVATDMERVEWWHINLDKERGISAHTSIEWNWSNWPVEKVGKPDKDGLIHHVTTKDREKGTKIILDRLFMLKAREEGLT